MYRILLIDDEPDFREAMVCLIRREGFDCSIAEDGLAALSYLHSHPCPDLILVDNMMPHMGGIQFRQEQLKDPALAEIPTVLFSAGSLSPDELRLLHFSKVLTKPFRIPMLVTALKELIENRGADLR